MLVLSDTTTWASGVVTKGTTVVGTVAFVDIVDDVEFTVVVFVVVSSVVDLVVDCVVEVVVNSVVVFSSVVFGVAVVENTSIVVFGR